jgi:hypothetical protein
MPSSSTNDVSYTIGGITIKVQSDLPISDATFHEKYFPFQAKNAGLESIVISHHFGLPDPGELDRSNMVYHHRPWKIYAQKSGWLYTGFTTDDGHEIISHMGFFNPTHEIGEIYHASSEVFTHGGCQSLTLFPTDQILLARLLADRQGCILHAGGMILNGQGLLFAGHSGAGKSTIVTQLRAHGEILCDDRNILRRYPEGWRVYGTWSHGDVPDVSAASAPLRAILLLEQSNTNRLTQLTDRREIVRRLPFLIVKPLVDAGWWEQTLDLVGHIAREVPVYRLQFDQSGRVYEELKELIARSS